MGGRGGVTPNAEVHTNGSWEAKVRAGRGRSQEGRAVEEGVKVAPGVCGWGLVMPPTRLGSTQLKSCGFDSAFFLKNRESKPIHRLSARFSLTFDLSCGFDKSRG